MNLEFHANKISACSILLLTFPLIAAAFTHLWNPIGFPYPLFDEGTYLGRAMNILTGQGLQDKPSSYLSPYFGQLFLAGALGIVGYPNSLHPSADGDVHSIEMLWFIPRVLMGLLAIIDTLILFMISERYYNKKVALIASILFAVMPITWLNRWILLDSIQLPFLLSSILFAVYSRQLETKNTILLTLLSGSFLGIAIFTKTPAIVMIPLVSFLIFTSSNRQWKILGLWFIPVILIPLIWPAYAISDGEFDRWFAGIFHQMHREEKNLPTLFYSINYFFKIDPILLVLGLAGLIFRAIKRDFLLFLWVIPFLIFFYLIGLADPIHLIVLIPTLCIGAAALIADLSNKVRKKMMQHVLPFAILSVVGIFGLVNITLMITQNGAAPSYEMAALVTNYLQKNSDKNNNENFNNIMTGNNANTAKITLISSPFYSWIPRYVFQINNDYKIYEDESPIKTNNVLLVVDPDFMDAMSGDQVTTETTHRVKKMYSSCVRDILATKHGILFCRLQ